MHCLEAENCYICRGSNLVVDFSKVGFHISAILCCCSLLSAFISLVVQIKAPKKRGFDLTGRLSHLVYSDGMHAL